MQTKNYIREKSHDRAGSDKREHIKKRPEGLGNVNPGLICF
jgi:hypothetical protein